MINPFRSQNVKADIVALGRLLWEKNLASGLNGNVSVRKEDQALFMTAHGTCLGFLQEKDILAMNLDGSLREEGKSSTEKLLHTEIYKNLPAVKAIVHTHTSFINGYFLENNTFSSEVFESKIYLGKVTAIPQSTPAVTDVSPVITELRSNNIVVLKNHGVIAVGEKLFDCFLLIQGLEEAIKTDAISRMYRKGILGSALESLSTNLNVLTKKYELFSQEQIDEIVRLVNTDSQMKELGAKTQMTMDLAVKLSETGKVYSFSFKNGAIVKVGNDENAEFLITANENIWKDVFNQKIDPFVATTQKKMNLKGDFARISKWYAPCSRIFQLWQKVPVE